MLPFAWHRYFCYDLKSPAIFDISCLKVGGNSCAKLSQERMCKFYFGSDLKS